jgi:hypothetical protein
MRGRERVMPERDPRVDPRRGDVLWKNGQSRKVIRRLTSTTVCADDIRYVTSTNRQGAMFLCNWTKWAKDAEVIYAAT